MIDDPRTAQGRILWQIVNDYDLLNMMLIARVGHAGIAAASQYYTPDDVVGANANLVNMGILAPVTGSNSMLTALGTLIIGRAGACGIVVNGEEVLSA